MAGFSCLCKCTRHFFLCFQEHFSFRNSKLAFKNNYWEFQTALLLLDTSNTCDEYFAVQTQISSDASSCQTVGNLDAKDFSCVVSCFSQYFFIVSSAPTLFLNICLMPSQTYNVWQPNMSCLNTLSSLNLFSCYMSMFRSKQWYWYISQVCMDIARRDSCHLQ